MNISLFVFALILSSIIHFGVQKIFIYYKKFDAFNKRSSHNKLATRTGGIGVFTTILLICIFYYFQNLELFDYSLFIPLGIMFVIGVYDDFYNADFKLKFLLQIIVAKILIDQGYVISNYNGLFGLYEIPWLLAQFSTVFVFLIIVNAINFIDGIDGLAITDVIKTILLIEFFSVGFSEISSLSLLIISSLIPLYYFNFKNNRKIFLGDAGSLLLGTIVAVYTFYILGDGFVFREGFKVNKTLFSILILLYPLVDLLRVFIIRISNRKSPFQPDKNHLHHVLLNKGYSGFKALFVIEICYFFIFLILFYFAKLI
jgi:UDP-N-acetylmuramyl pentapeptide phosphotransferase/UDP-N-acetylglucosamine-1-phosphate transferase